MKTLRIQRDGDLDLQFRGELIGSGLTWRHQNTRGTDIRIWRTESGRYVVGSHRWSQWQGESSRFDAAVCDDGAAVLAWLRADSGDGEYLGPLSLEAWEEACSTDPDLEGLDVEVVA